MASPIVGSSASHLPASSPHRRAESSEGDRPPTAPKKSPKVDRAHRDETSSKPRRPQGGDESATSAYKGYLSSGKVKVVQPKGAKVDLWM